MSDAWASNTLRKGSNTSAESSQGYDPTPLRLRRTYTERQWLAVRPLITYDYMDLDMTLPEIMKNLASEQNFHATKEMYKKRLKAWGLTKHIKAEDKDNVIRDLLDQRSQEKSDIVVPHHKIVRYARKQAKDGHLENDHLNRILAQCTNNQPAPQPWQQFASSFAIGITSGSKSSISVVPDIPQKTLASPDVHADFELFLKAMRVVIDRERQEYLSWREKRPDFILTKLVEGLQQWRAAEFKQANILFARAARSFLNDLGSGIMRVSRICFLVSSIIWGSSLTQEPVFLLFTQFMANAATEMVGKDNPMCIILHHLENEQSIDAQIAIWDCALDGYQLSPDNVDHWWAMARRRWRWLQGSGRFGVATQHCQKALEDLSVLECQTEEMKEEALQDLKVLTSTVEQIIT